MEDQKFGTEGTDEFAVFYERYFNRIFRYAYRRISDVQTAEDIAQDTCCAAYAKKQDFLGHAQPLKWLFSTARNKIRELYRYAGRRATVPLEELELGREELRYEVKELELTALATLDRQEWELVKDYYLYGVTISELASAEGITENNMRVRLWRLKKRLRGY